MSAPAGTLRSSKILCPESLDPEPPRPGVAQMRGGGQAATRSRRASEAAVGLTHVGDARPAACRRQRSTERQCPSSAHHSTATTRAYPRDAVAPEYRTTHNFVGKLCNPGRLQRHLGHTVCRIPCSTGDLSEIVCLRCLSIHRLDSLAALTLADDSHRHDSRRKTRQTPV